MIFNIHKSAKNRENFRLWCSPHLRCFLMSFFDLLSFPFMSQLDVFLTLGLIVLNFTSSSYVAFTYSSLPLIAKVTKFFLMVAFPKNTLL